MASRENNSLTDAQQRAVAARGNVLVMAGAGTGKTHTLVARCLNLICDEEVQLSEILIVTFTEAAAAEMKQRLCIALENSINHQPSTINHLREQLALFDAAHIGTLHSFCFKLIREHFHELGLDPQISILDEGQTRLLADETLEEIFNSHYENEDKFSLAVQELIKIYGNGRDEKIRALIWRLHNYIQTRADSVKWLAQQIEHFSPDEPLQWRKWFGEAISNWCAEWLPILENLRAENPKAAECLEILKKCGSTGVSPVKSGVTPDFFSEIISANSDWPRGTKKFREPLEDFFGDAKFLNSLVATNQNDPLAEDWNWIRSHMKTLLQLTQEFSEKFSMRKRTDSVLDFHDLEQFALKLLWVFENEKPAEIAKSWRKKLKFIFVDEYQDINAAQDKIISALSSGTGFQPVQDRQDACPTGNRFLVGDVKQSIYRFRLADPKIFRNYANAWPTISLAENFRSRESILNFVNSLFEPLMREEIGGVNYDDEAKLKVGSSRCDDRTAQRAVPTTKNEPRTELLLRLKTKADSESENDDELADLEESEKEARLLALRLRDLKKSGHEIQDDKTKTTRTVEWRDMAILLRAPSGKAEIFAKQFEQLGIPLHVERGGFYNSSEILDLLSLLQLLDNPLQDVPCIAVLRSPLVGCSLDELAEIRLAGDGHFWFALNSIKNESHEKVGKFLEQFRRWRKLAQQSSLSQCLETILTETHYDDWLKSRPRGAQRNANVRHFLLLAEKFDQFQRQGLFRFLKFVEAQREIEADPEVSSVVEENAVRLMSIHQSKGLEFSVVALADLSKNFNTQDLRGEIIFDEEFGLCPKVKPPTSGRRYPSLPHWLAQRHQRKELAGEELRLLYVALTRARDNLILTGSVTEKKWETLWKEPVSITSQKIVAAKSYADWLGLWFANQVQSDKEGELPNLCWRIVDDAELAVEKMEVGKGKAETKFPALEEETKLKLQKTLEWQYGFSAATKRAAKSSATALRRQAEESDDEAEQVFNFQSSGKQRFSKRKLNAVDAGTAAHKFLQHLSLESASDLSALKAEAERLKRESVLSADERAALVLENVTAFWNSDFGKRILANTAFVKRELAFTAKFSPKELDEISGTKSGANLDNEFVVVQGVADLVVLLPDEIWLMDFKTDEVRADELADKIKMYSPQLKLYAHALAKIYSKPVTACKLHFLSAQKTVDVKI